MILFHMALAEGNRPPPTIFERFPNLKEIPKEGFPGHILIIPDGNRRAAQSDGQSALEGHLRGTAVALEVFRDLSELPIKYATIWGFSADNWKRNPEEVAALMNIFKREIPTNVEELQEQNRRFIHLGRKDRIDSGLAKIITEAEEQTAHNTGQVLSIAIDFGGSDQELRIAQRLKEIFFMRPHTEITHELLESLRDSHGTVPPADLLIRSSGEKRTSDIGWLNGAQTELQFIDKPFPQVTTQDIVDALLDFSKRQRRLGA